MAAPTAEGRIRDLERRIDSDPGSRLFVALAEEYRKAGRLKEALSAIQKGLLAHPGYIAAQVALGRVYLEANQTTDAIATFAKVLVADPGNLVAAKLLADVYLSRGDSLEAIKKYKLYRALSGDRRVDELIARLESEVAPRPVIPPKAAPPVEMPPPPPSFQEMEKAPQRRSLPPLPPSAAAGVHLSDPFDITSVSYEFGEDSDRKRAEDPFPSMPTRDVSITPSPAALSERDAATRVIRIEEALSHPPPPAPEPAPQAREETTPPSFAVPAAVPPASVPQRPEPDSGRPTGRALADLYYDQGHYAEALQIYDDLVTRHPFDEDLKRMRRDAEARLLPAGSLSGAAADPALERRLAKIRALKQWLSRVQAG